jgi:hypothetical protein
MGVGAASAGIGVGVAIGAVTGVGAGAIVGAGVGVDVGGAVTVVDGGGVTVGGETMSVKTAVQPTVAVIVIVPVTHVPPPNQPLNVDPAAGVASSVTNVPFG